MSTVNLRLLFDFWVVPFELFVTEHPQIFCADYKSSDADTKMPIRWSAPECVIHQRFSSRSDCWSYGNFDILLDQFSRISGSVPPTYPATCALPILVGS